MQLKFMSDTLSLDVPACLKKELDTVLVLQSDLEASDRALQAAQMIIKKDATQDTLEALQSLEHCHAPNMFGTVNMERTIDLRLSWSER